MNRTAAVRDEEDGIEYQTYEFDFPNLLKFDLFLRLRLFRFLGTLWYRTAWPLGKMAGTSPLVIENVFVICPGTPPYVLWRP